MYFAPMLYLSREDFYHLQTGLFAPLEVSFPHCHNLTVPGKLKNLRKLTATQISAIFVFTFSL